MVERKRDRFETVRRGYDVDEVNQHLDVVERRHQQELEALRAELAERDRRIAELQVLTAEVEEARTQKDSISAMLRDAGRERQAMLDEASEAARQRVNEAESKARELRRETEREMSELRRNAEAAMDAARSGVDAKVDRKIQAARDEARLIVANAEASVDLLKRQTNDRLDERQRSQARELEQRQLEADREHVSKVRSYQTAEKELSARVEHLQAVRDSLVTTLTAIAEGGLRAGGRLNLGNGAGPAAADKPAADMAVADTLTVGGPAAPHSAEASEDQSDPDPDSNSDATAPDPVGDSMVETST